MEIHKQTEWFFKYFFLEYISFIFLLHLYFCFFFRPQVSWDYCTFLWTNVVRNAQKSSTLQAMKHLKTNSLKYGWWWKLIVILCKGGHLLSVQLHGTTSKELKSLESISMNYQCTEYIWSRKSLLWVYYTTHFVCISWLLDVCSSIKSFWVYIFKAFLFCHPNITLRFVVLFERFINPLWNITFAISWHWNYFLCSQISNKRGVCDSKCLKKTFEQIRISLEFSWN